MTPLADFTDYKNKMIQTPLGNAVWACVLDSRYGIEVRRSTDAHQGIYTIFDLDDSQKIIHQVDTPINYGAIFGPDVMQVMEWEDWACAVVDNLESK